MKKFILAAMLSSLAFGQGFMQEGMSGNMHMMLSSERVLSEGENKINIGLKRADKTVNAKDVRIKFFMPEMPGMPYMESKDICKKAQDGFECKVNFSMGGTWQYQLFIKDEAGKEHKHKGSVNLGQASSMHHHH